MSREKELAFTYTVCHDKSIVAQFKPDPGSHYFQGHFPGNPIVPGVLLLEVSLRILARSLQISRAMVNLRTIKKLHFFKPVLPDDNVEIHLVTVNHETRVKGFSYGEVAFDFSVFLDSLLINR
jgi:3-hydroxymyristoyl/3-hydroxydecanoyl-(acyl carrier protein) dehydratase